MIINRTLWISSLLFTFILLIVFIGPHLPFIDPEVTEGRIRIADGTISKAPFPPSSTDIFGTDNDGRDLLSLIVMGAKDTLMIVFLITIIRYALAIPLGLISSTKSGPIHWMINGWNHLFSGLPTIFSAIILLNIPYLTFSENRMLWCMVIIALIEVGRVSHIFQEQSYSISKEPFVDASITVGLSRIKIFLFDYLPFLLPNIIVNFFLDLGRVMLLIGQLGLFSIFINQEWVQLSFGFGEMQNTSYNWATILGTARADIIRAFWIPFFPALAIMLTIITFNLMGEGLRQHFDRRTALSQSGTQTEKKGPFFKTLFNYKNKQRNLNI